MKLRSEKVKKVAVPTGLALMMAAVVIAIPVVFIGRAASLPLEKLRNGKKGGRGQSGETQ